MWRFPAWPVCSLFSFNTFVFVVYVTVGDCVTVEYQVSDVEVCYTWQLSSAPTQRDVGRQRYRCQRPFAEVVMITSKWNTEGFQVLHQVLRSPDIMTDYPKGIALNFL